MVQRRSAPDWSIAPCVPLCHHRESCNLQPRGHRGTPGYRRGLAWRK